MITISITSWTNFMKARSENFMGLNEMPLGQAFCSWYEGKILISPEKKEWADGLYIADRNTARNMIFRCIDFK